jgi:RNA polymerase sigma-70 factor (ECF subfamily)
MQMLSDESLMVAVMAGDRQALSVIVDRYYGPLFGYLYRLVHGDRLLAEDLCQETFSRILEQQTYQPKYLFKPWLYAIATNLARNHLKSAAVRLVKQGEGSDYEDVYDPSPGPEEQVQAIEQQGEIAVALAQLGDEYRLTLLLRFYQGFSLQEIAETLHIPLGTVKSRLSAGTRRLRELLSAKEGVGGR